MQVSRARTIIHHRDRGGAPIDCQRILIPLGASHLARPYNPMTFRISISWLDLLKSLKATQASSKNFEDTAFSTPSPALPRINGEG